MSVLLALGSREDAEGAPGPRGRETGFYGIALVSVFASFAGKLPVRAFARIQQEGAGLELGWVLP